MTRPKNPDALKSLLDRWGIRPPANENEVKKRRLLKALRIAREQTPNKPISKRAMNRYDKIVSFADALRENDLKQERTEALIVLRALALAGLPRKPTKAEKVERIIRWGPQSWFKVTYRASTMPYGQDRFVLAGIVHLAILQNDPVVHFETAGQLLKMFDIDTNAQGYRLLRERFRRLHDLTIKIEVADSEDGFGQRGVNILPIADFSLPSRRDIKAEGVGQIPLPSISDLPAFKDNPYGVRLSDDLWRMAMDDNPRTRLIIPINLLKPFVAVPSGWDFCMFLAHRCGAAKRISVVPHDALMSMFRDGKERDRDVVRRLKKYLQEIIIASDERIKAEFEEKSVPSRGRPRKEWHLKVYPLCGQLVWSGKQISET